MTDLIDRCGVIYYTYGQKFPKDLESSVNSIRKHNKKLKIAWITEIPNHPKANIFDYVIESKSNKKFGWHKRTESLLLTPFEITLHLDSDTVINDDLIYGFEKADKFNLAICHAPAYYGKAFFRMTNLKPIHPKQPIYNCGAFFYKKNDVIWQLFNKWIKYNDKCVVAQDQTGLSNAIEDMDFNPYVLTKSWNFRAGNMTEGHGPIFIWHSHKLPIEDKMNNESWFKLDKFR